MISVTVDHSRLDAALRRYVNGLHDKTQAALVAATEAAQAGALLAIRATTVRRTGDLQDNWTSSWRAPYKRGLTNHSKHARFIDSGTRPHIIAARRVQFLRFEIDGVTYFRRSVFHPGTKPRPWIALALASGQMALRAGMRQGADDLARAF